MTPTLLYWSKNGGHFISAPRSVELSPDSAGAPWLRHHELPHLPKVDRAPTANLDTLSPCGMRQLDLPRHTGGEWLEAIPPSLPDPARARSIIPVVRRRETLPLQHRGGVRCRSRGRCGVDARCSVHGVDARRRGVRGSTRTICAATRTARATVRATARQQSIQRRRVGREELLRGEEPQADGVREGAVAAWPRAAESSSTHLHTCAKTHTAYGHSCG